MYNRIIIVGSSGSGKSTLAKELSQKLKLPYIELDAFLWQENWMQCPKEEFKSKITEAARGESWVMDGNYSSIIHLTWSRATTLIWLDYPIYISLYRAFKRSLQRIRSNEKLWNGNYESYQRLFSKDSILLWIIKSHWRRKSKFLQFLKLHEYQHLKVIRLRSPKEARDFIMKNINSL